MRTHIAIGRLLAFGIVFGLASHGAVRSCSCSRTARGDTPVAITDYDAVFEGEPVQMRADQADSGDGTRSVSGLWVRFRVFKAWRGPEEAFVWIHTGNLGGGCGIDFRLGERYIVLARVEEDRLSTGICQPTGMTRERPKLIERLGAARYVGR
jgi:hypothetical protein